MKRKGQWYLVVALLCILSSLIVDSAVSQEKEAIILNLGCCAQLRRGELDGDHAFELQRLIETYTNGRVKFKLFGIGEVHANFIQQALAVRAGEWDACVNPQPYFGLPQGDLAGPYVMIGNDEMILGKSHQQWFADPRGGGKFKQILKEKGGTILYLGFATPYGFWAKKEAHSLADWQKLKMRAAAGLKGVIMFLRAIGAVPVTTTAEEAPMALKTGVVDGTSTAWNYFYDQKMYDLAPLYWPRNLTPNVVCHYGMMSNKAWGRLPADIQKIIQEKVTPEMEKYSYDYYKKMCLEYGKKIEAKTTAYSLSDARIKEIKEGFKKELYPYYEGLDPEMWGVWKRILDIK